MSASYWLGVVTLPVIALACWGAVVAWFGIGVWLDGRLGVTFDVKWKRDVEGISDYILRNHIWWERSFGPIFVGGWYREPPTYGGPSLRLINRWVGIGRADGPCVVAFRKRTLDPHAAHLAAQRPTPAPTEES